MQVVRLCKRAHSEMDGVGASITGGRWNSPGIRVVYTASCSALAILEYRVHMVVFPRNMELLRIEVSDTLEPEVVDYLPNSLTEMRQIGDEWATDPQRAPVLAVPSVIAPRNRNYLLNPEHPKFTGAVTVVEKN